MTDSMKELKFGFCSEKSEKKNQLWMQMVHRIWIEFEKKVKNRVKSFSPRGNEMKNEELTN